MCLKAAIEGGAVPRIGSKERRSMSPSGERVVSASPIASVGCGVSIGPEGTTPLGDGTPGSSPSQSPSQSQSQSQVVRRRAMSATLEKVREAMPSGSNKKDLVQWFLPSEKHRKESLLESAQQAADAAEEARRACRSSWVALRAGMHKTMQVSGSERGKKAWIKEFHFDYIREGGRGRKEVSIRMVEKKRVHTTGRHTGHQKWKSREEVLALIAATFDNISVPRAEN